MFVSLSRSNLFRRYRNFSVVMGHYPYIFLNKEDLYADKKERYAESVLVLNSFLDDEHYKLREGFTIAYQILL